MIFQVQINQARRKLNDIEIRIEKLTATRARVASLLAELPNNKNAYEKRLATAYTVGEPPLVPVHDPDLREIQEYYFGPFDERGRPINRAVWTRAFNHLTNALVVLDKKIQEIRTRKTELESWLAEKEKTWGQIDPAKLEGQIREVLFAAEELSQFVVGRKVEIAFDLAEGAPLGHVRIRKKKRELRKVYLSASILGEQPVHLNDHYRALIIHELGHILLHLKDSGKDYKQFRKLLRGKFSVAPDFFPLFNTLLDEQLERILRDTKPDWQRWFNRLEFYTRKVPLADLRTLIGKAGHADPDQSIEALAKRRLIKVYPGPGSPFAVIQSAEIFSDGLGFSRLSAFFNVLRHRLPLASVREPWLTECIACIPKDFKTLDVFGVHALAVEIYKIMMRGNPSNPMVKIKVLRSGSETPVEIEVPGSRLDASDDDADIVHLLTHWRKRHARAAAYEEQTRMVVVAPPSHGEGEPPPPEVRPQTYFVPPRPAPEPAPWWPTYTAPKPDPTPSTPLPSWAAEAIKESKAVPTKKRAKPKHASKRVSSKEKIRRRHVERDEARKAAEANRPKTPEREPTIRKSVKLQQNHYFKSKAVNPLEIAFEPVPSWSADAQTKGLDQALNQIVNQVREQLAAKNAQAPVIDRMSADAGNASDLRNTGSQREFPNADQILRLTPDRVKNVELTRSIKPFSNILGPYLTVIDPEKVMQEPLTGGRRILASGLKKHMAYGEMRIFADLRLNDVEQHKEVLVCVLVDTSASMKTDARLDRAKRLATILAESLKKCPDVESVFLGYNQNVYRCGNHEEHSISSLEPSGKTNEAGALDYLRKNYLEMPRRRKAVIVLSDGLPTACTVESVRWLVRSVERELGARFLYGALTSEEHPAYRRRAPIGAEINAAAVRDFGRAICALLR